MREVSGMSCGVRILSGFSGFYGSSANELNRILRAAKRENNLVTMTITDDQLKQQSLVDALKEEGFEQVCRWENRTHPNSRYGGSMCNLFILRPVVQVQKDHPRPAKYNWMDKRRSNKK